VDAFEVVLADAVADADDGDGDAVIGTDDTAVEGALLWPYTGVLRMPVAVTAAVAVAVFLRNDRRVSPDGWLVRLSIK
jgi:hypothetical protein